VVDLGPPRLRIAFRSEKSPSSTESNSKYTEKDLALTERPDSNPGPVNSRHQS
jgi:hypothetical protein